MALFLAMSLGMLYLALWHSSERERPDQMRLDDQRESSNIENRRGEDGFGAGGGMGAGGFRGGGGMGGGLLNLLLPLIGRRFGILGIVVVLGAVFLFSTFTSQTNQPALTPPTTDRTAPQTETQIDSFVAKVLGSTEDTWGQLFETAGGSYQPPTLVFFENGVNTACGGATSAVGPFYCPADRKVYLDTRFFDELANRFGAPGDFAAAYVVAHEVGHHIQTLLGTSAEVSAQQRRVGKAEANQLSVRMELQADCYAGVWAGRNRDLLDSGDFAEGVKAAQSIGDDTLQRAAQGRVVPDSFTHGTSDQRIRWLTKGFDAGNPNACDSFSPPYAQL